MSAASTSLTTIGFDADDTLWRHEHYYQLTEARFAALLSEYAAPEAISETLLAAEKRNLAFYGYGIKGFTLSMIETALELTAGRADGHVIAAILAAGREMLRHPVETLPGVRETLSGLAGDYGLILITKGDLFDQERKLAESGLGELFAAVEIVSEKTASTYERIFARHGDGPQRAMMVGNSLKSDIVPAIAAGSWGVHVPHELNWALDRAEAPVAAARFRRVARIGELPGLLGEIN
jgi:putative hydrolase of the HAD superfamily